MDKLENQINTLRIEIADLKRRFPAHSVKPSMILELENLEDRLAELLSLQEQERLKEE